ncbi:MAG TPA: twin-arginine translocase TatA/TatE family subunit [Verrucomicrobiae bacterium]|nr:twin-arginine translocase TatA/TatE family subunit [Verrucomicrobiae bacterium]
MGFGPLGGQEMVFIFLLALVLFGPKKLPEIARTVGKAINEFRRASSELKTTFDREMSSLESESRELKEIGAAIRQDTYNYNYDYSSYEATYEGAYSSEEYESHPAITAGESAPQDAELTTAEVKAIAAPEGTVAQGDPSIHAGHATDSESAKPEPVQASTEHHPDDAATILGTSTL